MTKPRKKQSVTDQLDAWATHFLAQQEEVLAKHMAKLEAIDIETRLPNNDPEYLKAIEARDKTRAEISNKVDTVHIIPDNGKTHLGVTLTNPRHHADAREVGRLMAEHFEAKLIAHEDPADKTIAPDHEQKTTPKHEFGREKRSLPR